MKDLSQKLEKLEKKFDAEQNLIELKSGNFIFVGDTHGDFEATKKVIEKYLKSGNKLIFLGDYVDRGTKSQENIDFLLSLKLKHPEVLFLLMGNHEGRSILTFYPANFWESLSPELYVAYSSILSRLPLAVSTSNGIIALHGALPDVPSLEDINKIKLGSEEWRQITWGDWQESEGEFLGDDTLTSRPQFGQKYFEEIMSRFGKNVLIRSHQPGAKQVMYNKKCLTIFTSSYSRKVSKRTIAIVESGREVKTTDDITIESM